MSKLHIDIETFSSVNLVKSGVYKYCESPDFNIILFAYAFDNEAITVVDTFHNWKLPERVVKALRDPSVVKCAHNANFERVCLRAKGYDIPPKQWECSAIKAAYCGLPLSLASVTQALELGEKGKKTTGRLLIKHFCAPCKPTKANDLRVRNSPEDSPEKWEEFKDYCLFDVEAEREVMRRLSFITIPEFEHEYYVLDQEINDRGVKIDKKLVAQAIEADRQNAKMNIARMVEITGLGNPNSQKQLTQWLTDQTGQEVNSITKEEVNKLLQANPTKQVQEVLNLRGRTSKASIKKYQAMVDCINHDDRARGLFQFYGAYRTGRWAGRRVQLQNLARNYLTSLEAARSTLINCGIEAISLMYDEISSVLSQLIRTSFIPSNGNLFAVADFSAIEARVLSWLAKEEWKLQIFRTHGKIYEALASKMYGIPIESIKKDSPYRQNGKSAELALGYEGSVGALKKRGEETAHLTEQEMWTMVRSWRSSNPSIVKFWRDVLNVSLGVVKRGDSGKPVNLNGLVFYFANNCLIIKLLSGRCLIYQKAKVCVGKFGGEAISYMGQGWVETETYGGKLTENIVQAIARDLLLFSMAQISNNQIPIVMHVHDEVVCEVPELGASEKLAHICDLMAKKPAWAEGLPLSAEGFTTPFYRK